MCVFCKIVNKEIPAAIIFENELVLAFMDAFPASYGHALVIPKEHVASLTEIAPLTWQEISKTAQKIAVALKKEPVNAAGISLLLSDGETAGQEVFHAHLHVIPRRENDGLGFCHGTKLPATLAELKILAESVKL